MNAPIRNRIIENIHRNSTDTQRLDPSKPMPHIICKEALPHMERPASVIPPLLAGMVVGIIVGITLTVYFS
jgi:hypothetical protein